MAMNLGSGNTVGLGSGSEDDHDVIIDVNTTPLIDVMLVLLVMLIITIPIQLHSVNLNMPSTNSPPPLVMPQVVKIDVTATSQVLWQGVPVVDDAELMAKLQALAAMTEKPELHLRPDKKARYEVVAKILAATQRLGITKLGILGGEQFAD
jgi:biopolymer transport protein ExbD